MINKNIVALLSLVLLVIAPSQSPGSPSPSLSVTTAWLQENLPSLFVDFDGLFHIASIARYRFNGCRLTMNVASTLIPKMTGTGSGDVIYRIRIVPSTGKAFDIATVNQSVSDGNSKLEEQTTINFRDVQPQMSIDKLVVDMNERNQEWSILSALHVAPKEVTFPVDRPEMGSRLQSALKHLAEICGAQKDPF